MKRHKILIANLALVFGFILLILCIIYRPSPQFGSQNSPEKIAENYFRKQNDIDDFHIREAEFTEYDNKQCVRVWYDVKPGFYGYERWIGTSTYDGSMGTVYNKTSYIVYHKLGFLVITTTFYMDPDPEKIKTPESETAAPGSETAAPGSETAAPGSETAAPGSETAAP